MVAKILTVKKSMEWFAVLQKEWNRKGKSIDIQHARSPQGEKVIECEGVNKFVHYKVGWVL